ncbi:MAG: hypothetical protein ACE5K1_03645 [Acidiferrobacterales bacterium]
MTFQWFTRQAEGFIDYFVNAVRVYVIKGEEDAKLAALTAAKVSASVQRESMMTYLDKMTADIHVLSSDELLTQLMKRRLQGLKATIATKNWTLRDIKEAKAGLRQANSDYATALDWADPKVFANRHPELFKQREFLES